MLMTALQTKAKKLPEKPAVEQKGFKAFLKKNIYIIIAFFLPFVLMTIGFAIMEVSPFGDKQILVTDLWHQYYPFLVDFQDKLKHGESLFWSWTQGGGVNYFSLMSYYLAGPMNFLCVFIPSQWLRENGIFRLAPIPAHSGYIHGSSRNLSFQASGYTIYVSHFHGYKVCLLTEIPFLRIV